MNVRQGSVLDGKWPQRDRQPQLGRMHVLTNSFGHLEIGVELTHATITFNEG